MILNFVRYLPAGEQDWQSWKFSHSGGRLRSFLGLSAPAAVLRQVAAALDFALSGTPTPLLREVALQLSDNGGHTWLIQRRGDDARISKNGTPCAKATAEAELVEACLDSGDDDASWQSRKARLTVGHFAIRTPLEGDGELSVARLGATVSAEASLKASVDEQLTSIAAACAQRFHRPQLADPKVLTALGRRLEPLRVHYAELCRQYAELKGEAGDLLGKDHGQSAAGLVQELELLDQLASAAEPLLQPGVSLKGLKDELNKAIAERAELRLQLGLDANGGVKVDFHRAIAHLARVEAQARLIQSVGKAKERNAQQIEPLFQRYLQLAEGGLGEDQQTQAELASCLASLTSRLKQKNHLQRSEGLGGDKQKTWFDRFKGRAGEGGSGFEETPLERDVADLETAHMAITYTLGRLGNLSQQLKAARQQHDSARSSIENAYEELVRGFSRMREAWQQQARQSGLPEDMDLSRLLNLAAQHGSLATVEAKYQALSDKVQRFQLALSRVERLLLDWRKATGSQKTVDLSSAAILISEASSLLRYREPKRQRLAQVKEQAVATKAAAGMLALLKKRRQALITTWTEAFAAAGLIPLEIHDEGVAELCRSAQLVQALAMVPAALGKTKPQALFAASPERFALTIYRWDDEQTPAKERLALLAALDQAGGDALHLLLLADEGLNAAIAPAGLGKATQVASPVNRTPVSPQPAPQIPGAPKPTPNVIKGAPQPAASGSSAQAQAALLNDKARRTLAMLTAKKP